MYFFLYLYSVYDKEVGIVAYQSAFSVSLLITGRTRALTSAC